MRLCHVFRISLLVFPLLASQSFAQTAPAPTNLTAEAYNSEVVLRWDGSDTTTAFNVERATEYGGKYSPVVSNWSTSEFGDADTGLPLYYYTDTTADNGTTYYYRVSAVNGTGMAELADGVTPSPDFSGWLGGWVQQHRHSAPGDFSDEYDMTGLTATYTNRTGPPSSSTVYLGNQFGDINSISAALNRTLRHFLLNGTSTFTWKYIAPNDPQGLHNDPLKPANDPSQPFPTPSLFTLAVLTPSANSKPGTDTAFAGSAAITDGFGWGANLTFPASPQNAQIPAATDPPRRKIVSTTLQTDKVSRNLALSPSVKVDITAGTTGKANGSLTEAAYALTMDYPDSTIRPDLADPKGADNQFVYSASDGTLTLPARILTSDYLSTDLDWLVNKDHQSYPTYDALVDWRFDMAGVPLPGGGSAPRDASDNLPNRTVNTDGSMGLLRAYNPIPNASNGTITPSTQAAGNPVYPALIFDGLPARNSGFGNHTVTLGVKDDPAMAPLDYKPSQTAYIQTFFPGKAGNFSGPADDFALDYVNTGQPEQNWAHYYNQVFPFTGPVGPNGPTYNVQYVGDTVLNGNAKVAGDADPNRVGDLNPTHHLIRLTNEAFAPTSLIHVFAIDKKPLGEDGLPNPYYNYVRWIGDLQVDGIFWTIAVVAHEQGHVNSYVTAGTLIDPRNPNKSYYGTIFTDRKTSSQGTADWMSLDEPGKPVSTDNIWDTWEYYNHMNPASVNTTGANFGTSSDGDTSDTEVLAEVNALGAVLGNADKWNQDWADQGVQSLASGQPYYLREPYNTTTDQASQGRTGALPVFYFRFRPNQDCTPSEIVPPGTAGITAPTTPIKALDGAYEVRNLQDLKSLYPTLVESLDRFDQ